jgi:hypothetical protein
MSKLSEVASWIDWWCQALGITDPIAVHVAEGAVATGVLLVVIYLLGSVISWALGAMVRANTY